MSGNGNGNGCEECCKIPVCLEFVGVSATPEFRDAMKEMFIEIFSEACCGENGETMTICHVTPSGVENTLNLPLGAAQAHLNNHSRDYEGACNGRFEGVVEEETKE